MQYTEKVVRLRKGKLGMAKRSHRRQQRCFLIAQRSYRLISVKQREQMIKVHGDALGMPRVFHQEKPFHEVALDGLGQIVDRVGTVGEAEVDNLRGLRIVSVV